MADSSFDVVSKVDRQEVDNALNQAAKELSQRFDFRGTNASISWAGEQGVTSRPTPRSGSKAALEVFKEKLIKRSISLKALDAGDPQASGKTYKISAYDQAGYRLRPGPRDRQADPRRGPQGCAGADPGRPAAGQRKKKDDLQAVIALLKEADLDVALQFTNYR